MSEFRRGTRSRLSCALVLGAVATAGAATPATAQDPMSTNIPYTAWAGTQVRMVECSPALEDLPRDGLSVTVESWSGAPDTRPQVIAPSLDFVQSRQRDLPCARVNVVSLGDGLARIKLKAFDERHLEILEHQFLGIWMQLGVPAIDAAGPLLQVKATGSFPHPLGPGGRFTLPNDWATLAGALADSDDPADTDPRMRWDIHGDALPAGDGPFDPVRLPSLLSDGRLDARDAPMPAARVDVAIAPNGNPLTDVGGAGALVRADKAEAYDGQYVPATAAEELDPAASGTDWFVQNNFGLNHFGFYDNWDTLPLKTALATETGCNRTVDFEHGAEDSPRMTPSGDQTVAVFTDEHGEAQVEYVPYAGGFFFDAVGAIVNDNRGCDLQDVDVLGTSAISATAKYPGQPVDFPAQRSATIVKTVSNEFDRSLRYYPTGAASANIVLAHGHDIDGTPSAGERVCFYVDDKADSYRLFSGVTGPAAARLRVTSSPAPTPASVHPDVRCAHLDANGNAALEVFNRGDQTINVIAEYLDDGLLRGIDMTFGAGGSSGPGTNPPSARQIVETIGAAIGGTKTTRPVAKTRIAKARIIRIGTKRYVVVNVKSSRKRVELAIRLKFGNGLVLDVTKKVRANRTVRVMRLSRSVKSVKVKLA